MTTTTALKPGKSVKEVTLFVGIQNPEDGDCRRTIRVYDDKMKLLREIVPPPGVSEESIILEVGEQLRELGFTAELRQPDKDREGFHITYRR